MKAIVAALAAAAIPLAAAHYTFPDFIIGSTASADWQYIRETANHYSNAPVTSVTDPEFRCYELDLQNTAGQTSTATVSAGSTIGFQANGPIYHPGYLSVYLSQASPAANSPEAGTEQTWFKVYQQTPVFDAATHQLNFPSETQQSFTFTLPESLPSGQYLARVEQIALHVAETYGGAQFYIGCAQLNVENGGSGNPGPLVSIPGVYTGYEPGILLNIYDLPQNYTGYQAPGPAVWQG
ncbi:glycoside hydrolase family 61 protein [Phanerochaete carnosa HHB-10118-sp]|uniref:lytic cellulose monooxygenase (C4-dehydrogenating) n=1 Tax=Phanerochaete carnosa (strain HHB-10118-sp) TaxID=650164 RepID=K5X3Y3_PHACS|nr:glycoside hydrolase family 61 protein [Phanerochaete carnosa HHB-10118-sp]EKM57537.1 glycoside hydrolase family 61 protein [Phanerochaete carnosa HHB-10118-sp]